MSYSIPRVAVCCISSPGPQVASQFADSCSAEQQHCWKTSVTSTFCFVSVLKPFVYYGSNFTMLLHYLPCSSLWTGVVRQLSTWTLALVVLLWHTGQSATIWNWKRWNQEDNRERSFPLKNWTNKETSWLNPDNCVANKVDFLTCGKTKSGTPFSFVRVEQQAVSALGKQQATHLIVVSRSGFNPYTLVQVSVWGPQNFIFVFHCEFHTGHRAQNASAQVQIL